MNIYVPNVAGDRLDFFSKLPKYFIMNMILLGDFNSVVSQKDHFSDHLDSTSVLLKSLLDLWNLVELKGSHLFTFTYHHPSLADRKSRLNCIYSNIGWEGQLGFLQHVPCLDHYMVGTFIVPSRDKGPWPWRFTDDLLADNLFTSAIQQCILDFHYECAIDLWENLKTCVQTFAQRKTKFHLKQRSLKSLCQTLKYINKHIFQLENLEYD